MNDLSARIAAHRDALDAAVARVLSSGWVILGPEVRRFEESFAAYLSARHCIGVANGTDALELALAATGVRPGDIVATAANAGMYATSAALALRASPLFLEVDPQTHSASHAEVIRALGLGARAVVVTHLYGRANPAIGAIAQDCRRRGVPLIEDCAQAHGARVDGAMAGSFGTAATFSFYPTKNLGALGDGGAVSTNDDATAQAVRELRQYGWREKYRVGRAGGRNSRLDELQAAILGVFLPHLDKDNERRHAIAARYGAGLRHPAIDTPPSGGTRDVVHLYVVRCRGRDALREHLAAQGIGSEIHYPVPDHRQPFFGDQFKDIRLECTEQLAQEVLTLPCHPHLSDEQVDRVIAAVNGWPA